MRRSLTIDEEIFLNQFTQKIHTLEEMKLWFEEYDVKNRREIIGNLLNLVIQSHPTIEEMESAAKELNKLKTTSAVILLNKNKPFSKYGYKICELPEKELLNGFAILLVTLLKADSRRRETENPSECNHWWHKDLSNQVYLEYLKRTHNTEERFS